MGRTHPENHPRWRWGDPGFWAQVDMSRGPEACWLWTGNKQSNGYGRRYFRGRRQSAHRVAYQLRVGPIPVGLQLDHLCRNILCVNPSHLEAVTPRINVLRSRSFTAINATKTHCPRGHAYTDENTLRRARNLNGRECLTCIRAAARAFSRKRPRYSAVGRDHLTEDEKLLVVVMMLARRTNQRIAKAVAISTQHVSYLKTRWMGKALSPAFAARRAGAMRNRVLKLENAGSVTVLTLKDGAKRYRAFLRWKPLGTCATREDAQALIRAVLKPEIEAARAAAVALDE